MSRFSRVVPPDKSPTSYHLPPDVEAQRQAHNVHHPQSPNQSLIPFPMLQDRTSARQARSSLPVEVLPNGSPVQAIRAGSLPLMDMCSVAPRGKGVFARQSNAKKAEFGTGLEENSEVVFVPSKKASVVNTPWATQSVQYLGLTSSYQAIRQLGTALRARFKTPLPISSLDRVHRSSPLSSALDLSVCDNPIPDAPDDRPYNNKGLPSQLLNRTPPERAPKPLTCGSSFNKGSASGTNNISDDDDDSDYAPSHQHFHTSQYFDTSEADGPGSADSFGSKGRRVGKAPVQLGSNKDDDSNDGEGDSQGEPGPPSYGTRRTITPPPRHRHRIRSLSNSPPHSSPSPELDLEPPQLSDYRDKNKRANRRRRAARRRKLFWSPEEEEEFVRLVTMYKAGNWRTILDVDASEDGKQLLTQRNNKDLRDKAVNIAREMIRSRVPVHPAFKHVIHKSNKNGRDLYEQGYRW